MIVACDQFFCFVHTHLRNSCIMGNALSYDITVHFFKGLLSTSMECEEPIHVINSILYACRDQCPILLSSAARWWLRLEPVLCCQWKRLSEESLPRELKKLMENQHHANSVFSLKLNLPPSDSPWISAAFTYFTFQRQTEHRSIGVALKGMESNTEQLLSLFFFTLVDLISATLQPKEKLESSRKLEVCVEVIRTLEGKGVSSWLTLFLSGESEHSLHAILYRTTSDLHTRLLPLAFCSVVPTFDQRLLSSVVRRQEFLFVAVMMYTALVRLFLEGENSSFSHFREQQQSHEQTGTLDVITRAQQFLLHIIPQCPLESFSCVRQLQDSCGDLDPEVEAALAHYRQTLMEDALLEDPDLL
ncbi:Fanconi anemia group A protein [Latimeria chalumnae]|nr:PREDICTED: Fanconi anemia group A protein [Latimeria chalumnae]|eukprot:XP_014345829.1 PREDICTED: Fanconi anemia group A protein [Latimeria chalumnae]